MKRASINDLWVQLVILNFIIFLFANIFKNLGIGFFTEYFAMPIYLTEFVPKFWTILTYQFLHQSLGHVFNNMILLYIFGHLAQSFFGRTTLLSLYIIGGFFAAFTVFLSVPFYDYSSTAILLGASGSIFAITVAVAVFAPDYILNLFILGTVKIKWVALVLVIIGTIIDFSYNVGGTIAHIGGIIFGYMFGKQMQQFNNILRPVNNLIDKTGLIKKSKTLKKHFKTKKPHKYPTIQPTHTLPKQFKLDQILDKISKTGLDSLTEDEKTYLERQSHNS
ncbi:MAG: rhomboid family intramembrane serine protease [Candidatus Heimdallarchaeota archaeon]